MVSAQAVLKAASGDAGDSTPRRIIMTGFCVGGSLATIAACWAALQSPTSDVRCITFGAPHSGNAAFVEAFRCVRAPSMRIAKLQNAADTQSRHLQDEWQSCCAAFVECL